MKPLFFNSRYELIYGGEFRWTPGGHFSDVLQQKTKHFLRQRENILGFARILQKDNIPTKLFMWLMKKHFPLIFL